MKTGDTALVLVDVQEKLAGVMHAKEELLEATETLVAACGILELPVLWMEQIPEKMGQTVARVRDRLAGKTPITKAKNPRFIPSLIFLLIFP